MEGEEQSPLVSKVLDNDNLLIEIIIHVAFPTSLVRAALVCKRWLRQISDPKFLCRFCKLHPPRLLGFYVNSWTPQNTLCFVPMLPLPPELTAVVRRANFSLDCSQKVRTFIRDCWNDRVFTTRIEGSEVKHGVYNPLFPERGMSVIPPFALYQRQDDYYGTSRHVLSVKEGDDLSYLNVLVDSNKERTKSVVHVHMLRPGDGVWCTHLSLATDLLSNHWNSKVVLIDNKIYIPDFPSNIVILDFKASSLSKIRLPQGVEFGDSDTMLSPAGDASGVYLIHTKKLQLRIWLHKGDNWLMVDSICLVEMCANLRILDSTGEDEHTAVLQIKQVGDNVEFAFLQIGRYVLYFDIKCRTLRKIYEMTDKGQGFYFIYPFKMIWPPTFPPLKDEPSRDAL